MNKSVSLITLALAATLLSGCAAAAPSGGTGASGGGASGSGSGSGTVANSGNECSIAHDALAKVVTGTLSAPYQKGDTCYFGVGPNGTKSGSALAGLYGDSANVRYTTTAVASEYQGAKVAYSGSKPLTGVGTEAAYYDGGNGNPQVIAHTSGGFCDVQTSFNDATEVGLKKPSGSRTIAEADVPKLAADLGAVCTALFGG